MKAQDFLDPIRLEWVTESDAMVFAAADNRDNRQAFSRWDKVIQEAVNSHAHQVARRRKRGTP